eukprot:1161131-Pelagomonas_calceolata.AAC.6
MNSAPGLKLLLGRLMMLQCQLLQGDTGVAYCRTYQVPLGKLQKERRYTAEAGNNASNKTGMRSISGLAGTRHTDS